MTDGALCFQPVKPPTTTELEAIIAHIRARIGRYLERQGLLVRDEETSHLALKIGDDAVLDGLLGHSITYRMAVGSQQGQKVIGMGALAFTGDSRSPRNKNTRWVTDFTALMEFLIGHRPC